ncbi:MAG: type II secretion system F family protein [Gammaproteobacteria bacterium]|nr:MAG: type II secretion system F family protein [Gammaproteobacteria bacterium]
MPHFRYQGRTPNGELVTGEMPAESRDELANALLAQNIALISAEVLKPSLHLDLRRKPKVELEDKVMFCRQLHALLKAGVPTVQAINGLRRSTHNETLSEALERVEQALESGLPLAASLQTERAVFDDLFVAMVHVGENTGRLDLAFAQLARYLELERITRQRVKQALRYPIMVVSAIVMAVIIINIWVVPQFAGLFSKLGADLPLPTRILIGMSDLIRFYGIYLALGLFTAGYLFWRWTKTPTGRLRWHQKLLQLPIFGPLFTRVVLGRFARTFSMTYAAGLPILQALIVVARAVANAWVEQKVLQMRAMIERGESFTRAAAASELFTPLVMQMISVGETTGSLDSLLDEVGEFYEQEVEYSVKRLGDALEPILLTVIAAMVLLLALGVFLPMWDMYGLVMGKK